MKALNTFTGKIISDLDVRYMQSDQWTFPTMGLRVFNKDGKGLIATVVPGNELLFEITPGFSVVGSCQYNDILYLASWNEATGQGEIGSFPSPRDGVLVREYAPLKNYLGGGSGATMRSAGFNFGPDSVVSILPRLSWDGSVDLYLCDNVNPNRVINTGFKQDALPNGRFYQEGCFEGVIDLVPGTRRQAGVQGVKVLKGGKLAPGNLFFLMRYATGDYARTPFVLEIGPLSIFAGHELGNLAGLADRDWTTNTPLVCDRRVEFTLVNLDPNYKYVEIAVMRLTALTENAPAGTDCYLIGVQYPITGPAMTVTVTGQEQAQSFTLEQILHQRIGYNISKSHAIFQSRYLMANMKRSARRFNAVELRKFASWIGIGEVHDKFNGWEEAYKGTALNIEHAFTAPYGYGREDHLYERVGYFKDQIYPFAAVFCFDDGTLSEAFPCRGNLTDENQMPLDTPGGICKGLYRFKSWRQIDPWTTDQKTLSGVTFDLRQAMTCYWDHLTGQERQEYFGAVTGIFFVRGERIDNLVCQGALMRCFHSIQIYTTGFTAPGQMGEGGKYSFMAPIGFDSDGWSVSENNPDASAVMPLFRGWLPVLRSDADNQWYYGLSSETGSGDSGVGFAVKDYTSLPTWSRYFSDWPSEAYENRHGLFSPDICFEQRETFLDETGYVEPIRYLENDQSLSDFSGLDKYLMQESGNQIVPGPYGITLVGEMRIEQAAAYHPVKMAFTEQQRPRGKGDFSSYYAGDGQRIGFIAHSTVYNRNIGTCRYVGIADTGKNLRQCYNLNNPDHPYQSERMTVVNLYKRPNDNRFARESHLRFNPAFQFYGAISEVIARALWAGAGSEEVRCWKGDCFLQQTWIRTHRWYAQELGSGRDGAGNNYQHGFGLNLVTENKYNTQARGEVVAQDNDTGYKRFSFYPKVLGDSVTRAEWFALGKGYLEQESWMLNDGYCSIVSPSRVRGFDPGAPLAETQRPNRVYVSDQAVPGSFTDAFRAFGTGSFRDYNLEDGPITAIMNILDYPFLVQESGLCQLFLNEQKLQSSEGDLIIGYSRQVLGEKYRKIADFGSRHLQSLVVGDKGAYGFDIRRRLLWRVNAYQQQGGGFFLGASPLSEEHLVSKALSDILDTYSHAGETVTALADTPLRGLGISAGYDPRYKEIIMSFLLSTNIKQPPLTLVYDELNEGFRGMYPYCESLYMNLGTELLSTMHFHVGTNIVRNNNRVYLYNRGVTADGHPNHNIFFGRQQKFQLTLVVNGHSEDPRQNSVLLRKIFQALSVECRNHEFSQIIYQTLYQRALYPFTTDSPCFWMDAAYLEHKWEIPLAVQSSEKEDDFNADAQMVGMWMKVTLEYEGSSDIEIKAVETQFNISAI